MFCSQTPQIQVRALSATKTGGPGPYSEFIAPTPLSSNPGVPQAFTRDEKPVLAAGSDLNPPLQSGSQWFTKPAVADGRRAERQWRLKVASTIADLLTLRRRRATRRKAMETLCRPSYPSRQARSRRRATRRKAMETSSLTVSPLMVFSCRRRATRRKAMERHRADHQTTRPRDHETTGPRDRGQQRGRCSPVVRSSGRPPPFGKQRAPKGNVGRRATTSRGWQDVYIK